MVKKGSWVQIHKIVLDKGERAPSVPEDTLEVPLEMWVKGFLEEDSEIGEQVKIKTLVGRIEDGILIKASPTFKHNYGDFVPEILEIGQIINSFLSGDDTNG
ncbi:hypothetical protein HLPCO_002314 [Haloplasma contractile SSD-17B]|uniref:Uncharacterized protein n=2 Tax=Haloplasma TaxID=471824 RepID=U2E8Z3_9MOLU|nr:hypothetical protein HLPCO_002314 [Haloplasma contractile SSD-17B]